MRVDKIVVAQAEPLAKLFGRIADTDNIGRRGVAKVAKTRNHVRDFSEESVAVEYVNHRYFAGLRLDRPGNLNQKIAPYSI